MEARAGFCITVACTRRAMLGLCVRFGQVLEGKGDSKSVGIRGRCDGLGREEIGMQMSVLRRGR